MSVSRYYAPSARELFPDLRRRLLDSRPVVGEETLLHVRDEKGRPVRVQILGAPTFRNVGTGRDRVERPKRAKRTQTQRRRARRHVPSVGKPRQVIQAPGRESGPTPVLDRSHTWLERSIPGEKVADKRIVQVRPSSTGIARYGIRDLGWRAPNAYMTKAGKLTKAAQAEGAR